MKLNLVLHIYKNIKITMLPRKLQKANEKKNQIMILKYFV